MQGFSNWAGNHRCRPTGRATPASEEEVVELVDRARRQGGGLKPVGAGHSWSDIACTDALHVSLDAMRRVLDVDFAARRVRVQAGIRLRELNRELALRRLALPMLGSIAEQSVAGAISTGTHGSGSGFGVIATQVVALRIVTGTGEVLSLSSDDSEADVFRAAAVGLGAMGVVTEVTLQCVDAFRLQQRARPEPLDEVLERLPQIAVEAPYLKIWWLPHTGMTQIFAATPTERPVRTDLRLQRVDELANRYVFGPLLAMGGAMPAAVPAINRVVRRAYFQPVERVDRSDRIMNLAMPPRHREMEYAIPIERTADALRAMRATIERFDLRVNFPTEIRFGRADDLLMSPAFGRPTCFLGAYIGDRSASLAPFFSRFEQRMLEMGGRPHWGKEFDATAEQLRAAYPSYDRFVRVRDRLDPDRVLDNAFLRRVLP